MKPGNTLSAKGPLNSKDALPWQRCVELTCPENPVTEQSGVDTDDKLPLRAPAGKHVGPRAAPGAGRAEGRDRHAVRLRRRDRAQSS